MADNLVFNLNDLSYSQILKNNLQLSKEPKGKDFIIDILSNITVNPIKEILQLAVRRLSLNPVINFGNYDNIVQDSFLIRESNAVIIFYELVNITERFYLLAELLSPEEEQQIIEKCKKDIDLIFDNLSDKPLVLFNKFSAYPFAATIQTDTKLEGLARMLNNYLEDRRPANVHLVDLNKILSIVGQKQAIDEQKFYKYKSLYTIEFLKQYVYYIENILRRSTGKLKKALVFDCDNTLWKGILGEDGFNGIDMSAGSGTGIYYSLAQKIAIDLSKKGILICLCSKNNLADVEEVIEKHQDMLLKNDHIVAVQINWNNKFENLKALAEELNIGIDSFVFVDDSEFEIELINTQLPEIDTVLVPKDIKKYPGVLLEVAQRYFNLNPLNEDLQKLQNYKQQKERTTALKNIGNIDDYLATLETKIEIIKAKEEHVPRISQMTQKTNQFNLTTIRYTEAEIQKIINTSGSAIYIISVSDKFGDSGITGLIILKDMQGKGQVVEIDSYLLSCRILGRRIETTFLDYVLSTYKMAGYKTVLAKYIPTNKNGQVKNFFADHHFTETANLGNEVAYQLDLLNFKDNKIDFIKIISH